MSVMKEKIVVIAIEIVTEVEIVIVTEIVTAEIETEIETVGIVGQGLDLDHDLDLPDVGGGLRCLWLDLREDMTNRLKVIYRQKNCKFVRSWDLGHSTVPKVTYILKPGDQLVSRGKNQKT